MSIPNNISGSRASAVLGLSKYQTQIEVWLQLLGKEFCIENKYEYPEFDGNTATRFGSAFESAIIKVTEKVKNISIIDREKYFEEGYITCHCDGLSIIDGENILIENKTTSNDSFYSEWGEEGTDRIPLSYQVQVQHNLYLTGLNKCLLGLLVFPKRQSEFEKLGIGIDNNFDMIDTYKWTEVLYEMGFLKFYTVEKNEKLQSLMLEKYEQFWNVNIIGKVIPEIQTLDDIKKIYTEPKGTVVADEEIERISTERKLIQKEISEMKKNVDKLKLLEQSYMYQHAGEIIDDETREKTVLLDRSGKKLASYSKSGGMR